MKKHWIYIVKDSEGRLSHHKSLKSAQKRADAKWKELPTFDGPRQWRAGSVETYHVTITEVRLWD